MDGKKIEAVRKRTRELIREDPSRKRILEEAGNKLRTSTIKEMLTQHYYCPWAGITVVREGEMVTINWEFASCVLHPEYFYVIGTIEEIRFAPPDFGGADDVVVDHNGGNGSVQLKLVEGCVYYFYFTFMNRHPSLGKEVSMEGITFQVAIPVRDSKKLLLKEVLANDPGEVLRSKLENILNLEDSFDEWCKIGVERIKAKKLPPDEEKDKIRRFVAQASMLKNEL